MPVSRRKFLLSSSAVIAGAAVGGSRAFSSSMPAGWKMPAKRPFRSIENEWITLKDGTRLAARMWIPLTPRRRPFPSFGNTCRIASATSSVNATRGGPRRSCRMDLRSRASTSAASGDSDGVLLGEYLQQEQDDALEVIAWLARQPWSNGSVGMRGISWGGFNSLQTAALAPPALKAIIPQCATDNRYTDDAHYVGGALTLDIFDWGAEFKTVLVGPPDPAIVGDRVARDVAQPSEGDAADLGRMALASTLRWVLAAWFGRHGLFPHQVPGLRRRRASRFLPRFPAAPSRATCVYRARGSSGRGDTSIRSSPTPAPDSTGSAKKFAGGVNGCSESTPESWMNRCCGCFSRIAPPSEVWPKDVPGRWVTEPSWPSPHIVTRATCSSMRMAWPIRRAPRPCASAGRKRRSA